ncbi:MAG: A24 family peptidase, partial [Planctomycetota bacterium]
VLGVDRTNDETQHLPISPNQLLRLQYNNKVIFQASPIVPKTIWFRSGTTRGIRFLLASMRRYRGNHYYLWAWIAGSAAIVAGWFWGWLHWKGMLTGLVGLLVGGGVVWSVRLVAGRALQREAMGFGDVTLMAMIGTFVGWQPSLLIFFLAPFAGAIIAVIQYLVAKQAEIAYGPFLCVATVYVLVRWGFFWDGWGPLFAMGWMIPALLGVCLILMGFLLVLWRRVRLG